MGMKNNSGAKVSMGKGSVWKGGAPDGPVAATAVGVKKQGKGVANSSKAGKGTNRAK